MAYLGDRPKNGLVATIGSLNNSSLSAGDGDNKIEVENFTASTLLTGDGDSDVGMDTVTKSSIEVGNGVNRLSVEILDDSSIHYGSNDTTIHIGDNTNSSVGMGGSVNADKTAAMMHDLYTAALAMAEEANSMELANT